MDAYKKATAEKYLFLLVDCFPTTDEEQRLRQSIFPDQKGINWVFKLNRIRQHVHLLHVLSAACPHQRNAILMSATNEQIKTLCEICQNVLAGNVPKANVKRDCILNEEETPEEKAKLLPHWIPKYQRLMQQPPPQKPFEIPNELLQETEVEQEISSPAPSKFNMIAK
ncbi:uncharacterized protein TNIN_204381 [Trichonephila inaurata madagascariensis]|uniref:Uncharacterized protein n=1 Tax=Trichonephila inaurata madagascariensis TaxID=2747483 RepID=A0A8X7BUQ7_9ARAC|nr:uncharacterized protein TNIN_204381 [Trichonephila inaurata madagascariensis]